jgi:hypothetical protein
MARDIASTSHWEADIKLLAQGPEPVNQKVFYKP